MLIPRYYFTDDYVELYDYFLTQPHRKCVIPKGEYLWKPGDLIHHAYYIESGICMTSVQHEEGHQKILYFHSKGCITPGFHYTTFKIEQSITTKAISDMQVLEFSREELYSMFQQNSQLSSLAFESYAKLINLLIYETAHQEYNNSFLKLCNLLYLFTQNSPGNSSLRVELSQENIADILTLNRVNVAKCLSRLRDEGIIVSHRKWIEIIDKHKLELYCSQETLNDTL